jgi:ribosomal protein L7Ae-like RNA K-turn-binding protein
LRNHGPGGGERGLLGLLGLAARARELVSGTEQVRGELRKGRVRLVVLAADAAPGQRSKLVPLLEATGVRYYVALEREQLGAAIGRSPVSAVALKEAGFARRAAELLEELVPRPDHVQERA